MALPSGERLAFSTDSFVVKPLRFPGGSIGHLAVHGTVNDLAVMGARPAWLSAAFVLEEGFADRRAAGDRRRHGARPPRRPGSESSPVTPRSSTGAPPTGSTSPRPGWEWSRRAAPRRRAGSSPGDVVLVSGTIADHGMAVMLARGDLALEADIRSDTRPARRAGRGAVRRRARRPGGCGTRPAAAWARSATSWPATPTWPSSSTSARCRSIRRSAAPATCSASTRCTWPTRASSSPWSAPDEADAALAALRAHPLGAGRGAHRRDPRRPARHRGPAHRASAAPGSSTCSSATRCPGSADGVRGRGGDDRPSAAVRVTGTVQGVGFRPFVYRHARRPGAGRLRPQRQRRRPDRGGGSTAAVDELCRRLTEEPPPLARGLGRRGLPDRRVRGDGEDIFHPRERRRRRPRGARQRRHGDVRRLPGRDGRSRRPPLPLSLHQLHQLRTALHHRAIRALRPAGHDHGRLHHVRRLPARVRRPRRPAVPRPAQRLPGLRPDACRYRDLAGDRPDPRRRCPRRGRRGAPARRHPGRQGPRRLPPGRRRHGCRPPWPSCAGARPATTSRSRSWWPTSALAQEPGRARCRGRRCPDARYRRPIVLATAGRPPRAGSPAGWRPGWPRSACCSPTPRCTTCCWRAWGGPWS